MALLVVLLTFLAAFAGTVTGFGTSTILVPILSLWYPLPETLLFVGVVHWVGDIWKMVLFRKGINGKLILSFGLPGIIVAFLAARLPTLLPETQLKHLLGIFLVGYVIFLLAKPKWRLSKTNLNAVLGGSLSGLGAALFGTGGAIRGAFLSAFNLDKGMYLFTSGAIGLLIDSSRLIGYHTGGINLTTYSSLTLFFSVLIASFGAFLAKRFVTKIPQAKFRYLVTLALSGIGLRYIFL